MAAPHLPPEGLYAPQYSVAIPSSAEAELDLRMLASTTYIDEWHSLGDSRILTHQVQDIALPDRHHRRLRTDADPAGRAGRICVVNLLGWTETVNGPIIRDTHAELAALNPDLDISTEATYGIDGSDRRPHWGNDLITLDEMAEETFAMMQYAYGPTPLIVTACSMDAGVLARIEKMNNRLRSINNRADQPVNIVGRILFEGCLTSPENSGLPMAFDFGRHMKGEYKRIARQVHGLDRIKLFCDFMRSWPALRDLPAAVQQGISILGGTSHQDQLALDAAHPIDIRGTEDCLTARRLPGLQGSIVHEIENAGHGMGALAVERAAAITEGIRVIRKNLAATS